MRVIFAFIFVTSSLVVVKCFGFTDTFPEMQLCRCHWNNFTEQCIAKNIELIHHHLEVGVPKLRIPPFEPYRPDEDYRFLLRDKGTLLLTNISITGITHYTISNVVVVSGKPKIEMKLTAHFPFIYLSAIGYKNIEIFSTSITGQGDRNISHAFRNLTVEITVRGENNQLETERFYLSGLFPTLKMKDSKKHRQYFGISSSAVSESNRKPYRTEDGELIPVQRPISWTVLDDAAEVFRYIANNIFSTFPKSALCLY